MLIKAYYALDWDRTNDTCFNRAVQLPLCYESYMVTISGFHIYLYGYL